MNLMNTLNTLQRLDNLKHASDMHWDLVVIGGGITGAGIALDAASRGLKTLLVERDDFASGTSSRSTKLIHGGLRYLKQMEFRLVAEVGKEREILHRNAPHLVVPEKMILPIVRGGSFGKWSMNLGLWLYDRLAKVGKAERRTMHSTDEIKQMEPLLRPDGLMGAGMYAEYRTDDGRLTMEILKTAVTHGAFCFNYLGCSRFIKADGKISGIVCIDNLTGKEWDFQAKMVVNAAGPWVDDVRRQDGELTGKRLHHTKGVHLVVPHHRLPVRHSIYFDVPDGRMIFTIPRHPWTYLGTTDTDYSGDLSNPQTTKADADYLLDAANRFFPDTKIVLDDVVSSWAGIRPLIHEPGKSASQISRKDEVFVSPSGLVSIAGGKLTGYRKMAEKVVDLVVDSLLRSGGIPSRVGCKTANIVLSGTDWGSLADMQPRLEKLADACGLPVKELHWLGGLFGSNTQEIMNNFPASPNKTDLVLAALKYAVEKEGAVTLSDFFIRRTALLYFGRPWIQPVLEAVAHDLTNRFQHLQFDIQQQSFQRRWEEVVEFR